MQKIHTNDIEADLVRFLLHYHNTSWTLTGASPTEVLLKHQPSNHPLPSFNPTFQHMFKQNRCSKSLDMTSMFRMSTLLLMTLCLSVTLHLHIEARGGLTFHSELDNGCVFHRHINHIQHCTCATPPLHIYRQDFLPSPVDNSVSPHCWCITCCP